MKRSGVVSVLLCTMIATATKAQVRAGSPELQMFEQISAEANPDKRLELITDFEKQFPESKILARVYLMAVDVYRERKDRSKVNEYGEKVLKHDDSNITAMMLLARNYAIESKNLDRAVELAKRALDRMKALRGEPLPIGYSATQWKDYLRANEDSATQILQYVSAMKERADNLTKSAPASTPDNPAQPANPDSPREH